METYSIEEKTQAGAWVQEHEDCEGETFWRVHYIQNGTEYSPRTGYQSEEEAEEALDQRDMPYGT